MWDNEFEKLLKSISELEKKTGKTTGYKTPTKPKKVTKSALKKLKAFRKNIINQTKTNVKHTTSPNVGANYSSSGAKNNTKKQTKMQKEWAKQEKNLRRRIKNLTDKGYDVTGIKIPEKPLIITKKRISQLTELTRKKLLEQSTYTLPSGEVISGLEYDKQLRSERAKKSAEERKLKKLADEYNFDEVVNKDGKYYGITDDFYVDIETGEAIPKEPKWYDDAFFDSWADKVIDNFKIVLDERLYYTKGNKGFAEIRSHIDVILEILDDLERTHTKEVLANMIMLAQTDGLQLTYEVMYGGQGLRFMSDFLKYFDVAKDKMREYENLFEQAGWNEY